MEQLLRRSVAWVAPADVDAAIKHALAHPEDIYAPVELWPEVAPGDERPDEWVEDFDGPLAHTVPRPAHARGAEGRDGGGGGGGRRMGRGGGARGAQGAPWLKGCSQAQVMGRG